MLLGGYTALDLTGLEGQLAGRLLADLGMRVIKVEPPGGDAVRRIGPFKDDRPHPEGSLRFAFLNAGKESLVVEDESEIVRLAGLVDVVLESGPPGSLRHERLHAASPGLVTVAVTPFGESGPRARWRATDAVLLAAGGLTSISGDPALPPVRAPETQAYYYGSVWAALGAALALARGGGEHVEVSLQEAIASQEHMIREAAYDGVVVRREGSQHKHVAPGKVFRCRDGFAFLFVSAVHWPAFLALWDGHPPELDDDEWVRPEARRQHAEWLNREVERFTARFGKVELAELLQSHGIPCLPVNSPSELLADPHLAERGFFAEVAHAHLGTYRSPGPPLTVDGRRPPAAVPPLLGSGARRPLDGRADGRTAPTAGYLTGTRVLSLTTGIAGPTAARLLAGFGADVIKIESRAGGLDSFRLFGPDLDSSSRFLECNLGVRSLTLNLKSAEGLGLFRELVAQSDVVLENFRPDVLPKLGLGHEELRSLRPDLIVARMPGLGSTGPRSLWGTWGPTLAAYSGLTHLWNHPGGGEPVGSQGVYPDYVASVLAPLAVVAALLRRRRTGEGALLDLAQVEAAAYLLGTAYLEASVNARAPEPAGNTCPQAELHGCFRCRGDDRWCVIVCEDAAHWRALCGAAGLDAGRPDREGAVAAWAADRDAAEVAARLQAAGVACAPVQDAADLVADRHLAARGFVESVRHPRLGEVRLAGLPVRFREGRPEPIRSAPLLGEHDEEIVCGLLGRSSGELARWRGRHVVY